MLFGWGRVWGKYRKGGITIILVGDNGYFIRDNNYIESFTWTFPQLYPNVLTNYKVYIILRYISDRKLST